MAKLRIGMIGAGWVTAHHLDAYHKLEGVEVVAIADPDPAPRERRISEYGIAKGFASAEEMIADVALDCVDIASPREHHADAVRAAAKAGLAILCQKPLAPTLAEAEALVAGLPGGSRLMVHDNWRFRPHYRLIASWLAEGRVGRLRHVSLRAVTSGLLPDAEGCRFALERQPMLAGLDRMLLMEVLIHHVDTLRFLLGDLELRGAVLGHDCPEIRGEDRAALFLATPEASVSVLGDFMAHGEPPALSDWLEIQGTDGAIRLQQDRLTHVRGGETVAEHVVDLAADYAASYAAAIGHFLDCTRLGAPYETAADDNLRTLAIIERAYATYRPAPAPAA